MRVERRAHPTVGTAPQLREHTPPPPVDRASPGEAGQWWAPAEHSSEPTQSCVSHVPGVSASTIPDLWGLESEHTG